MVRIERRIFQGRMMSSAKKRLRVGPILCMLGLAVALAIPSLWAQSDIYALKGLASKSSQERIQFINQISSSGNRRLIELLEDYRQGNLFLWDGRVVLVLEVYENEDWDEVGKLLEPVTREPLRKTYGRTAGLEILMDELEDLSPGPKEFRALRKAKVLIDLSDPDRGKRLAAIKKAGDLGNLKTYEILAGRLEAESQKTLRLAIRESQYIIQLKNLDSFGSGQIQSAILGLQDMSSIRAQTTLETLAIEAESKDIRLAAKEAAMDIESWHSFARGLGHVFSGLSLGSILVLMALGLSIIFGLMGVINMAHGELMMIGAYSTYVVQMIFERVMPQGAFNWYYVCAVPVSFVTAAGVGIIIEILVIRHLYGRPLETLLATWGISLVLIQAVRLQFGDNIAVNSPTWLRGGMEVLPGFVLPYNRCFIIALTIFCVVLTYLIMGRTKIGLLIRATTQNRNMASSLGVSIRRVDAYTFGFGAGLAGIAGCALTLIGGVTPDMGQNYIVDSFLVVVTGGVGKLAGAVWAGFGLGCLNKLFEPFLAAVWGKVVILALVVLFIQWRPSGLFPPKGRLADV